MQSMYDKIKQALNPLGDKSNKLVLQQTPEAYQAVLDALAGAGIDPKNTQKGFNTEIRTSVEDFEDVEKGLDGKKTSYSVPTMELGMMSPNPDYAVKPSKFATQDLHKTLRDYSHNVLLNSILFTRANQVASFARPSRYSEKGQGFKVRLKDITKEPTEAQLKKAAEIEEFLVNTGREKDVSRDSFTSLLKKITRETYELDQVNIEKVYDSDGELSHFVAVDPATIFIATDKDGNVPEEGRGYVQVLNHEVVARFTEKELIHAIRNPRTDIYAGGYGLSELELSIRLIMAHYNMEMFNSRFFSHGGTTRGVLALSGEGRSGKALKALERHWKNSLRGSNASWQIPIIQADDIKFINMTPNANDMQFETWANYLVNSITSLFQIDPAEINFPNNGGAAGSKGGSLNEGNSAEKTQASHNKGLLPLLAFFEDMINQHIVSEFGNDYYFQFEGGDIAAQLDKIKILKAESEIATTANEIRAILGREGDVPGGDIPLNGVAVQREGQVMQQTIFEHNKQQTNINMILENSLRTQDLKVRAPKKPTPEGDKLSTQDVQAGVAGNSDNVNGKGTLMNVGKDGQSKDLENTGSQKLDLE